jgi:hypothetical protein
MSYSAIEASHSHSGVDLNEESKSKSRPKDTRIFMLLVLFSFPIFMLVAIERRMAGAINDDIAGKRAGLFSEAKEYATSTIALAFQSQ